MAIGGKAFFMDREYLPPCLRIDLLIYSPDPKVKDNYKIEGVLIDTGSDLTIFPNKVIKKMKLKMTRIEEIESFTGDWVKVKIYSAKIIIDNIVEGIFEIGGVDSDALIRMDLIKDWCILMNGPNGTFEIANKYNYKIPVY